MINSTDETFLELAKQREVIKENNKKVNLFVD